MHILGLGVTQSLSKFFVEEGLVFTEATSLDDLTNLLDLDRRNDCYQFDIVLLRISRQTQVMYPFAAYQTGIRKPIIVLYDTHQFAAVHCADWYRHGALTCIQDSEHHELCVAAIRSLVCFNRRVDYRLLTIGPMRIDTIKKEVTVDSEVVRLTPYEYRALELLARRRNRHVCSEDIFYEMCGRGDSKVPDDSIVKVYVSKLRKALKKHGIESVEITTAYGIGYRLIERAQCTLS